MSHPVVTDSVAYLLKQQTALHHTALENALHPELEKINSTTDYAHLLKIFFGFFFSLEKKIEQHITEKTLPDIKNRRKAFFILNDLKALHEEAALPLCADLPLITNDVEAFGALYVLEGSTLGGKHISHFLLKKEAGIRLVHLTFFMGYGENTGKMWKAFQGALNSLSLTEEDRSRLIETANQTFIKFRKWIEKTM